MRSPSPAAHRQHQIRTHAAILTTLAACASRSRAASRGRHQGLQILIPVAGARSRSHILRTGVRGDGTNAIGIDVTLPIVVGRDHEADVGARGQIADGMIRRRRPAAPVLT